MLSGCDKSTPLDRGSQLYANLCQSCHQKDGHGARGLYAPLAGTPVAIGDPDEMIGWVMYGERPASLPRGQFAGAMPQFNFLSDADAAAVLTHVRSTFGNTASAVDAATVAQVRARHAGR
jgi:mono/diheme cytochrome c family protein